MDDVLGSRCLTANIYEDIVKKSPTVNLALPVLHVPARKTPLRKALAEMVASVMTNVSYTRRAVFEAE